MIYTHDGKDYDVSLLSEEGQRAFQLLALAEQRYQEAGNNYVIAQAASVALHTKLQEFLIAEAVVESESDAA